MAMRPPRNTGGKRPTGRQQAAVKPVYEDFKPVSEWIQDEESDKLLIHVSGFTKVNLQVSTEGRNTLRVRGERLITGNKWQRFQEDYHVPDYCNIRGTRARFELGILTINVPKKITHKDHVPKPTQDQSPAPASAPATGPALVLPPKPSEPSTTFPTQDQAFDSTSVPAPVLPPKPSKPSITYPTQDPASASASGSASVSPPKPSITEPRLSRQKGQRKPIKAQNLEDETKAIGPYDIHQRTSDKQNDRAISEPSEPHKMLDEEKPPKKETDKEDMEALAYMRESIERKAQKGREKEDEESTRTRLVGAEHDFERRERSGAIGKAEYVEPTTNSTMNASSSSSSHFNMENLKKSVKFLAEKDEERQLLVNVGAAVLVIVALGTYIYNTIGE